jgi:hypothetical protein
VNFIIEMSNSESTIFVLHHSGAAIEDENTDCNTVLRPLGEDEDSASRSAQLSRPLDEDENAVTRSASLGTRERVKMSKTRLTLNAVNPALSAVMTEKEEHPPASRTSAIMSTASVVNQDGALYNALNSILLSRTRLCLLLFATVIIDMSDNKVLSRVNALHALGCSWKTSYSFTRKTIEALSEYRHADSGS